MGEPGASPAVAPRSNQGTLLALIVGNLLPLFGVLFLGWDLLVTFLIFWLDNVLVGVFAVLKIVLAEGSKNAWGEPATFGDRLGKGFFFVCFYGGFALLHGVAVLAFFGLTAYRKVHGPQFDLGDLMALLPWGVLLTAALVLLVSHGMEFYLDFIRTRAYETATYMGAAGGAFARLVLLQVVLVGGGALAMNLRAPVIALVILVALKTLWELIAYLVKLKYDRPSPSR